MLNFKFNRRTVLAAARVLEAMNHGDITAYLFELGSDIPIRVGKEPLSKTKRINDLLAIIDQDRGRKLPDNEFLQDNVVEKAITLLPSLEPDQWGNVCEPSAYQAALFQALEMDGFTFSGGALRRTMPEIVNVEEAEDHIFELLKRHNFTVAEGHLRQAFAAHSDGHWASANAQIRSFLDGLLDEIAVRINQSNATLQSGQQRRIKLADADFLYKSLNEWDGKGLGFINGLVKRLHPEGSHPGLSSQEDSTFRLQIVLITVRLLLIRFDRGPQK